MLTSKGEWKNVGGEDDKLYVPFENLYVGIEHRVKVEIENKHYHDHVFTLAIELEQHKSKTIKALPPYYKVVLDYDNLADAQIAAGSIVQNIDKVLKSHFYYNHE